MDNNMQNTTEFNQSVDELEVKAKTAMEKLSEVVKKYKELGVALCAVVGAVATCYWNIACDIFYRGYADGLGIDIRYIQNDSHSLLITVLIFIGSSILLLPGIKIILNQFDRNLLGLYRTGCSIGISFLILVASLAVCLLMIFIARGAILLEVIFMPFVVVTLSLIAFLLFLVQFIVMFWGVVVKKIKHYFENKIQQLSKANRKGAKGRNRENKSKLKSGIRIGFLILAIATIILSVSYLLGWHNAVSKKEFEFIVDDFQCEITPDNSPYFNLILSQTDDYYCLSACVISEVDGNSKITIFPDYQTIVTKTDESTTKIIRKRFDFSVIQNN